MLCNFAFVRVSRRPQIEDLEETEHVNLLEDDLLYRLPIYSISKSFAAKLITTGLCPTLKALAFSDLLARRAPRLLYRI